MKHSLLSLVYLLYSLIDRRLSIKLRFAMAQLHIMKEKLDQHHIVLSPEQRNWLLSFSAELDHDVYDALGIVTKQTFKRWIRDDKYGKKPKTVGRKSKFTEDAKNLICEMAENNRGWGIKHIFGELKKLRIKISLSSIRRILRKRGITPPPQGSRPGVVETPWMTFLNANLDSVLATDFFCKSIWTWKGKVDAYCLFFIHLETRQVYCSHPTFHPGATWMMQQARNVSMWLEEQNLRVKYLLRDNDRKYTKEFDAFFKELGQGQKGCIIRTVARAPNMNAFAEVFVGSVKRECLNHFVGISLSQIHYVIQTYLDYYNHHRPHQGKGNIVLDKGFRPRKHGRIRCRHFLQGLLKSYYREAA